MRSTKRRARKAAESGGGVKRRRQRTAAQPRLLRPRRRARAVSAPHLHGGRVPCAAAARRRVPTPAATAAAPCFFLRAGLRIRHDAARVPQHAPRVRGAPPPRAAPCAPRRREPRGGCMALWWHADVAQHSPALSSTRRRRTESPVARQAERRAFPCANHARAASLLTPLSKAMLCHVVGKRPSFSLRRLRRAQAPAQSEDGRECTREYYKHASGCYNHASACYRSVVSACSTCSMPLASQRQRVDCLAPRPCAHARRAGVCTVPPRYLQIQAREGGRAAPRAAPSRAPCCAIDAPHVISRPSSTSARS